MNALHLRDEGEGEPLVLLHGLGSQSRAFDPLFALRGARRLLAVDLPRTARSGRWAASTPVAIATALLEALTAREVQRCSVFGHSFGGLVAMELAARAPERVTALTVAAAPAFGLPRPLRALLTTPWADAAFGAFGRLTPARGLVRAYLRVIWGSATPGPDLLDAYEEVLRTPGFSEGMLEAVRAIADWKIPAAALASSPGPRAVICGEVDPLVSTVEGERLATAIGASLTVLDDVGHAVPEEAPRQLAALLFGA